MNWLIVLLAILNLAMVGKASWYSSPDTCRFNPDPKCKMANQESLYDAERNSESFGASWTFPLGALVKVTNLQNGKSVIVRITDRGPAKRLERIIDLGKMSFARLANPKEGIIKVNVEEINHG